VSLLAVCCDNWEASPPEAHFDTITVFNGPKPYEEELYPQSDLMFACNARCPIPGPLPGEYPTAPGDLGPSDAVVADSLTHRKHVRYKCTTLKAGKLSSVV
jgi:hypothetical protein